MELVSWGVMIGSLSVSLWILARLNDFSAVTAFGVVLFAVILPTLALLFALIFPGWVFLLPAVNFVAPLVPFVALFVLCLALRQKLAKF